MRLTIAEIAETVTGEITPVGAHSVRPPAKPAHLDPRLCVNSHAPCGRGRTGCAPTNQYEAAFATGLAWDSRAVEPGDLYVALPGERADGHDFAAAAVKAGATAVLATRPVDVDAPVIVVDDAMRAVADLAAYWRGRLRGTVVGLTGSTGKTTTKNLVRDVLSHAGTVVATKANQNNELGVPATLLAADEDTDFIVVEMGMRGLGQIAALCEIARPDWGLVTNVGESHIELLGSRQNIARAKAELLAALPQGGIAFVNAADELLPDLLAFGQVEERDIWVAYFGADNPRRGAPCAPAGEAGTKQGGVSSEYKRPSGAGARGAPLRRALPDSAFVWAEDVALDEEGRPSFNLCKDGFPVAAGVSASPDGDSAAGYGINQVAHASEDKPEGDAETPAADRLNGHFPHKCEGDAEKTAADRLNLPVRVKLALRGMHNVSNACSAAAVGLAAGLTLSQCAEALAAAQPEAGRQQVLRTPAGVTVVDDSYNANPDSMGASLATFAAMDVKGRRVAVLGDMLELGDFAQAGHERMGALAAGLGIDRLVCVGALSRDMARAARESGMAADAVSECADAAAALAIVIPELRPGDAVLAKASHSIGLESVVEGLVG